MNCTSPTLQDAPEFLREELGWNLNEIWEPMVGGRTNRIWKVVHPMKEAVVCKLYAAHNTNALFPNDPRAEALVLRTLEATDFAPKILRSVRRKEGHVIFYEFVPGQVGNVSPELAAGILAPLHKHPPSPELRTIPSGSAPIRAHAYKILHELEDKRALLSLEPSVDAPTSAVQAFLHGDPVPANMIECGPKVTLIDWQCPATGDPCEDIAIFLSPAMQHLYGGVPLSQADQAAFWKGYGNDDVHSRYDLLKPLFHWRMAIYCCWMAQRGSADYKAGFDLEIEALVKSEHSADNNRTHEA